MKTWVVQKSVEFDDGRINMLLIVGITASSKEEAQNKVVNLMSDDRPVGSFDLRPEAWTLAEQLNLNDLVPI